MPTTTELLKELVRAGQTFKGGTMLVAENRDQLVSELTKYRRTVKLVKASGATGYEIEQALSGHPVRHYLD